MVDIEKLIKVLPTSALAPDRVALLSGFEGGSIELLEPPAGQQWPYINPLASLTVLLQSLEVAPVDAGPLAIELTAKLRASVADAGWVHFFDNFDPDTPACLPVTDFIDWLRNQALFPTDMVDFLARSAEVSAVTPIFDGPDNRGDERWSLRRLSELSPAEALIEFVPGPPWYDEDWDDWKTGDNPFLQWRESMRPVAQRLEAALGEPVYDFADLDCETDDDSVHRWLLLHWCCSYKPESTFVRYLLEVTGACDTEALKAALIDPASYTQPFRMNHAFIGLEAVGACRLQYLPATSRKTVGVVFCSESASAVASNLLAQMIGMHALIIAPSSLASRDSVVHATRYCRSSTLHCLPDDLSMDASAILTSVDALYVIASEAKPTRNNDLMLPESVEDLLWQALQLGMDTKYYLNNGGHLINPEYSLKKRGVPERVAAARVAKTKEGGQ
ncbi:hypothetical protein [Parathalassolituus penaei]|uniref:Uncharacterized protein n=1 Tax=Parathalassolituus penaei TaxID=2997323 RepID=A0A9X3IR67_9GAMM|nr:hypothetical protein [Parathalassolituus penaei]MCY0964536.1 hypothetical protein [Parathalassolituus penaei]